MSCYAAQRLESVCLQQDPAEAVNKQHAHVAAKLQAVHAKSSSNSDKVPAVDTELFEPPASVHSFNLGSMCATLHCL